MTKQTDTQLYEHTNSYGKTYYLCQSSVALRDGQSRTIYYFSKNEVPAKGIRCALPEGYEVLENPRNGFLVVKKQTDTQYACKECSYTTASKFKFLKHTHVKQTDTELYDYYENLEHDYGFTTKEMDGINRAMEQMKQQWQLEAVQDYRNKVGDMIVEGLEKGVKHE